MGQGFRRYLVLRKEAGGGIVGHNKIMVTSGDRSLSGTRSLGFGKKLGFGSRAKG